MIFLQRGRIFFTQRPKFFVHSGRKMLKRVGNTAEAPVNNGLLHMWEQFPGESPRPNFEILSNFKTCGRIFNLQLPIDIQYLQYPKLNQNSICFCCVSVNFVKQNKQKKHFSVCFSFFRWFGSVSKQPKQTKPFRSKPKKIKKKRKTVQPIPL
jgi:hypothetical protein